MGIFAKIFHDDGVTPVMTNHHMGAIVRLFCSDEWSGAQAITALEASLTLNNSGTPYTLTAEEQSQTVLMKTHFNGLAGADAVETNKLQSDYISNVEGALVLAEAGKDVLISEAECARILGTEVDGVL